MRDGRTVKHESAAADGNVGFEAWNARLVVIEGGGAGRELPLDAPRMVVGRGPDVEIALRDEELSQQHVALEFSGGGLRAVDLGSTNGTRLNGEAIQSHELAHGDRLEVGRHVLQLVLEEREAPAPVYLLPDA